MLNLEQEKERYKSEVENVKAFLAEELQLSGNVTVWNRYKRECTDECCGREGQLAVRQNMKLYEKRLNDVVSSLVARARWVF